MNISYLSIVQVLKMEDIVSRFTVAHDSPITHQVMFILCIAFHLIVYRRFEYIS